MSLKNKLKKKLDNAGKPSIMAVGAQMRKQAGPMGGERKYNRKEKHKRDYRFESRYVSWST